MNNFIHNIDYLRQYVNGDLSPKEMFEIERASQDDEMLMDIIIGLEIEKQQKSKPFKFNINEITVKKDIALIKDKRKSNTWIYAAATIAAFLCISTVYYLSQKKYPDNQNQIVIKKSQEENKKSITTDSSANILTESNISDSSQKDDQQFIAISKTPGKNSNFIADKKNNSKLLPPSSRALPTTSMENPFKKKYNEDVLIAGNFSSSNYKDDILTEQILGADTKVARLAKNAPYYNEGKVRSDLQRLNIDPQTNILLNQVLDNQARNNVDINRNDIKSTYDFIDTTTTSALASRKIASNNNLSKSSIHEEGTSIIISTNNMDQENKSTKKIESNNIPKIGFDKYKDQIVRELNKLGYKNFYFNLYFDIDHTGTPNAIDIILSSDKSMNNSLIKILENGPKWKKIDDKKVALIIKD